jgi:hypothetical protein
MPDTTILGIVGVLGAVAFPVIVAVLTVHQWGFLRDRGWQLVRTSDVPYPSILVLSPVGAVQVANFVLLGVGLLATAAGLWQATDPRPTVPVILLGVAGVAAVAATAPTDGSVSKVRTLAGAVHVAAFFALLISSVLAALLLGLAFRDLPGWEGLALPSIGAAIALVALTIVSFVSQTVGGLASVLLELVMLGWFALVALRLAAGA